MYKIFINRSLSLNPSDCSSRNNYLFNSNFYCLVLRSPKNHNFLLNWNWDEQLRENRFITKFISVIKYSIKKVAVLTSTDTSVSSANITPMLFILHKQLGRWFTYIKNISLGFHDFVNMILLNPLLFHEIVNYSFFQKK